MCWFSGTAALGQITEKGNNSILNLKLRSENELFPFANLVMKIKYLSVALYFWFENKKIAVIFLAKVKAASPDCLSTL